MSTPKKTKTKVSMIRCRDTDHLGQIMEYDEELRIEMESLTSDDPTWKSYLTFDERGLVSVWADRYDEDD